MCMNSSSIRQIFLKLTTKFDKILVKEQRKENLVMQEKILQSWLKIMKKAKKIEIN